MLSKRRPTQHERVGARRCGRVRGTAAMAVAAGAAAAATSRAMSALTTEAAIPPVISSELSQSPNVTLRNAADNGVDMPWIGLGTGGYGFHSSVGYGGYPECFAEDAGCGDYVERAVLEWLDAGGRRLDCSNSYRNQRSIGEAIGRSGVRREELFLLSKVGPSYPLGYRDALDQFEEIKRDLRTDYVDLLLVHWPEQGRNVDPDHGRPEAKDPACRTSREGFNATECRLSTWRAMVEIWRTGGARAVGVSNYYRPHLEEIVASGMPLPALTQNPFHLYRSSTQQSTIDLCNRLGIVFNGYSPLGVPDWHKFPAGDSETAAEMSPLQVGDPVVKSVARAIGSTPAQALLAWQWQLGVPVNPRSQNRQHMADNLDAWMFQLSRDQMDVLGRRPQDWCHVDPNFYECAPDNSYGDT